MKSGGMDTHHPWYPTRNLFLMVVGLALEEGTEVVQCHGDLEGDKQEIPSDITLSRKR